MATKEDSVSARPITDTLRHIGGGVFIDLASDKMNDRVVSHLHLDFA